MTITNIQKPVWHFYAEWIAVNVISVLIAFAISFAIISVIVKFVGDMIIVNGQTHITEDYLTTYIYFPVFGLLNGCLQVLLLRRYLPRMEWRWIAATFLGWTLGPLSALIISTNLYTVIDTGTTWFMLLIGFIISGSIGLAQWLVLRQRLHRAGWWILANVLGLEITLLIFNGTFSSLLTPYLIPAILTGVVLWLLLEKLPQT
jgi:uncharacterized membrane protein required for colicin V production